MDKILFSPIGRSDPVNAGYDGAWIHCCRYCKPDLTVIYLSAEMLCLEKKDSRYSRMLQKLNQWTGREIGLEMEERPDLTDPHDFNHDFYTDFESVLRKYHKLYPEAELLVNISSGTPAMKSCLSVLYHLLPFHVQLIQVPGVHEELGSNNGGRATVSDDYDVDEAWKDNLDNLSDARNRCVVQTVLQQGKRFRIEQLKTLIGHHEYSAALTLAESDVKDYLPGNCLKALRAAVSRMQMDLFNAGQQFVGIDYPDGKTIRSHFKELLFQGAEMLLTMQVDLNRDDIAAAVRKLTPVLFSLIVECIGKYGIDIAAVSDEKLEFLYKSKLEELYPGKCDSIISSIYRDAYSDKAMMTSGVLMKVLNCVADSNDPVLKYIVDLRKIESDVRVHVAHKPVKLTEDIFQKDAGCKTEELIRTAQSAFELLNPSLFNSGYWESYDRMKECILASVASGRE